MSNLYVSVVVDLDDGQGAPGLGSVTTWPAWGGDAQIGISSIPQTAMLDGDTVPTLRIRASDDPTLQQALQHYWEEGLTNTVQNPPVYYGTINYADGATQYLSVLRLRMLATDPPDPTIAYATAAALAAHEAETLADGAHGGLPFASLVKWGI